MHRRFNYVVMGSALLLPLAMAGCTDRKAPAQPPVAVQAVKVRTIDYAQSFTLTGEVAARVVSDLSFRISGRLIERAVDVGAVVKENDLLARLEPAEQRSDADAAAAVVQAAEAKLRQVTSSFERQKALLADGFTTRRDFDNAQKEYEAAKASLDNARAQLGTARDLLANAELRAPAPGIITYRNVEAGQVVQSAQRIFTLAQDGPRDVVVSVQEALVGALSGAHVEIAVASDPSVKAKGRLRETSPALDPATGTVRVKIAIENTPAAMILGSAVTINVRAAARRLIVVPASALTVQAGKAAVWVIASADNAVTLKQVAVETFENATVVLRDGLVEGDRIVARGGQLLRPSQIVAPQFAQGEPS